MILVGNSRGGARDLAAHLLKDENDHVEIHELRGFASEGLKDALSEIQAISKGTQCRKFMFALSMNPPEDEIVSVEVFESAIEQIELRLGLADQPRAIVFHEKEGRRHAHVVWSRINADEMKAILLPYSKRKLNSIARDLYLEYDWQM
ncbi:MAG: relaxase, partial [Pseudomonadota bacterium]